MKVCPYQNNCILRHCTLACPYSTSGAHAYSKLGLVGTSGSDGYYSLDYSQYHYLSRIEHSREKTERSIVFFEVPTKSQAQQVAKIVSNFVICSNTDYVWERNRVDIVDFNTAILSENNFKLSDIVTKKFTNTDNLILVYNSSPTWNSSVYSIFSKYIMGRDSYHSADKDSPILRVPAVTYIIGNRMYGNMTTREDIRMKIIPIVDSINQMYKDDAVTVKYESIQKHLLEERRNNHG